MEWWNDEKNDLRTPFINPSYRHFTLHNFGKEVHRFGKDYMLKTVNALQTFFSLPQVSLL